MSNLRPNQFFALLIYVVTCSDAYAVPVEVCPPLDITANSYCPVCFANPGGTVDALLVTGNDASLLVGVASHLLTEARFLSGSDGNTPVTPDQSYSPPCGIHVSQPNSTWQGTQQQGLSCDTIQSVYVPQSGHTPSSQAVSANHQSAYLACNTQKGPMMVEYNPGSDEQISRFSSANLLGLNQNAVVNGFSVDFGSTETSYYAIVNSRQVWQWKDKTVGAFYPVGLLEPTPGSHDEGSVTFDFILGNYTESDNPQVYLGGKTRQNNTNGVFIERFRQGSTDPLFNGGAPVFLPNWEAVFAYSAICESVGCRRQGFFIAGSGFRRNAGAGTQEFGVWIHRYQFNGELNSEFSGNGQLFLPMRASEALSQLTDIRLQANELQQRIDIYFQQGGYLYWRSFDFNGIETGPDQWRADLRGIIVTAVVLNGEELRVSGHLNQRPQYLVFTANSPQSLNYYGGLTPVTVPPASVPVPISVPVPTINVPSPGIPTNFCIPAVDALPTAPDITTTLLDSLSLGWILNKIKTWELVTVQAAMAATGLFVGGAGAYGLRSCSKSVKDALAAMCCWACTIGEVKKPREYVRELSRASSLAVRSLSTALSRVATDSGGGGALTSDLEMEAVDFNEAIQGTEEP